MSKQSLINADLGANPRFFAAKICIFFELFGILRKKMYFCSKFFKKRY